MGGAGETPAPTQALFFVVAVVFLSGSRGLVRVELHARGSVRLRQVGREELRPLLQNRLRVLRNFSGDFRLLARGRSMPDIADCLKLSSKTVATYKYRLFEKLNVNNVVTLAHLASMHGVMDAGSRMPASA